MRSHHWKIKKFNAKSIIGRGTGFPFNQTNNGFIFYYLIYRAIITSRFRVLLLLLKKCEFCCCWNVPCFVCSQVENATAEYFFSKREPRLKTATNMDSVCWWAVRLNRSEKMNSIDWNLSLSLTSCFDFNVVLSFSIENNECAQKEKVKTIVHSIADSIVQRSFWIFIFWCFCGLLAYTSKIYYATVRTVKTDA